MDLLEDSRITSWIEEEVKEDTVEVVHQDDNDSQDELSECKPEEESVINEVPELTSDEEGRPIRSTWAPERYDPSTGESYAQTRIKICHNIVSQTPTVTLAYSEDDSKIVVVLLTCIKAQ